MSVSNALKKTTGLTGLAVSRNPQHVLGVLYSKILRIIKQMPADSAYRKYTEEIVSLRADVIKNSNTAGEIERQIDCGQVEELIIQAENELSLARNVLTWKAWEPLIAQPPPDQWKWPPTN